MIPVCTDGATRGTGQRGVLHKLEPSFRQIVQGDTSQWVLDIRSPIVGYTSPILSAASIMSSVWVSTVPVRVQVLFKSLDAGVLATGTANEYITIGSALYSVATAEALQNQAINSDSSPDIIVRINTGVINFHLDPNSLPSSSNIDLVTVMLHEFYHGLLFQGRGTYVTRGSTNVAGFSGAFTVFDTFLAVGNCTIPQLLNYNPTNLTIEVATAFTSGRLAFFSGSSIPLYNPPTYLPGSSVYHLNQPANSQDMCMSPSIPQGQAQRSICQEIKQLQQTILAGTKPTVDTCHPGELAKILASLGVASPTPSDNGDGSNNLSDGKILGLPKTTFFIICGCVGGVVVVVLIMSAMCVPMRRSKPQPQQIIVVASPDVDPTSGFLSPRGPGEFSSSQRFQSGRFFTPGGSGIPMVPQPGQVFVVDSSGIPVLASPGGSRTISFSAQRAPSFNAAGSPGFNPNRQASFTANRQASFTANRQASFSTANQAHRQASFSGASPPGPLPPGAQPPRYSSPPPPGVPHAVSPRSSGRMMSPPPPGAQAMSPRNSGRMVTGPPGSPPIRTSGRMTPNAAASGSPVGGMDPAMMRRGPSAGRGNPLPRALSNDSMDSTGSGTSAIRTKSNVRGDSVGRNVPLMRVPSNVASGPQETQQVGITRLPSVQGGGGVGPARLPSSQGGGNVPMMRVPSSQGEGHVAMARLPSSQAAGPPRPQTSPSGPPQGVSRMPSGRGAGPVSPTATKNHPASRSTGMKMTGGLSGITPPPAKR